MCGWTALREQGDEVGDECATTATRIEAEFSGPCVPASGMQLPRRSQPPVCRAEPATPSRVGGQKTMVEANQTEDEGPCHDELDEELRPECRQHPQGKQGRRSGTSSPPRPRKDSFGLPNSP